MTTFCMCVIPCLFPPMQLLSSNFLILFSRRVLARDRESLRSWSVNTRSWSKRSVAPPAQRTLYRARRAGTRRTTWSFVCSHVCVCHLMCVSVVMCVCVVSCACCHVCVFFHSHVSLSVLICMYMSIVVCVCAHVCVTVLICVCVCSHVCVSVLPCVRLYYMWVCLHFCVFSHVCIFVILCTCLFSCVSVFVLVLWGGSENKESMNHFAAFPFWHSLSCVCHQSLCVVRVDVRQMLLFNLDRHDHYIKKMFRYQIWIKQSQRIFKNLI